MYIKHRVSAPNFNTYRYSRAQWNDTFPGKKKGGGKEEGREGKREKEERERLYFLPFLWLGVHATVQANKIKQKF